MNLLIGFTQLFPDEEMVDDPVDYIVGFPKEILLRDLSAVNISLKPRNKVFVDTSENKQAEVLFKICRSIDLYFYFLGEFQRVSDNTDSTFETKLVLFSRQTCVCCIEKILNTSEFAESTKEYSNDHYAISLIKFVAAINSFITNIAKAGEGVPTIEDINAMMLPVNEMAVEADPIFELFRGKKLFDYLQSDEDLQIELVKYIYEIYGEVIDKFIFYHFGAVYMNGDPNRSKYIFYNLKEESSYFEGMCRRSISNKIVKLINVKKGPIYRYEKNIYLLLDVLVLSEKICTQFINDFWFDRIKAIKLKGKKENIKIYRGKIGYFYERYVSSLFEYAIESPNIYIGFDDLKVKSNQGEIEIADVYLRIENKILLCQQKSSSVYDNEKLAGQLKGLYKDNRSEFFDRFGVDQVISSIVNLELISELDDGYNNLQDVSIYPCVILTDKSFQTPFMAQVFAERFNELLNHVKTNPNHTIKKLSILFLNDIEIIINQLKHESSVLFDIIDTNQREEVLFTRPLTYNIHEVLKYGPPMDMIMAEYKPIFDKYSRQ